MSSSDHKHASSTPLDPSSTNTAAPQSVLNAGIETPLSSTTNDAVSTAVSGHEQHPEIAPDLVTQLDSLIVETHPAKPWESDFAKELIQTYLAHYKPGAEQDATAEDEKVKKLLEGMLRSFVETKHELRFESNSAQYNDKLRYAVSNIAQTWPPTDHSEPLNETETASLVLLKKWGEAQLRWQLEELAMKQAQDEKMRTFWMDMAQEKHGKDACPAVDAPVFKYDSDRKLALSPNPTPGQDEVVTDIE